MTEKTLVIEGTTVTGVELRPHDWPERLAELCATFDENHRITYSALVTPSHETSCGKGVHCLKVDPKLQMLNQEVYVHIMKFAEDNNLRIHEE